MRANPRKQNLFVQNTSKLSKLISFSVVIEWKETRKYEIEIEADDFIFYLRKILCVWFYFMTGECVIKGLVQ